MRRLLFGRFGPAICYAADGDGSGGDGEDGKGGGGGKGPSPTVPRAELTQVVGQRDQFKTELATRETELAELRTQLEKHTKKDGDAEAAKLREAGKFDELMSKKADEFAATIKLKDAEITRIHRSSLRDKLRAAVAAAENVATSAVDDVADLLLPRLDTDAANGHALRITTADGLPALDGDGKPVTIEGLVASFLTDRPHLRIAKGAIGPTTRGGPGDSGVGSDVDRARTDPAYAKNWKESDPDGFAKAVGDAAALRLTPAGLVAADRKQAAAVAAAK